MNNPVSAVKKGHRQKAFELLATQRKISRVEIARELHVSLQTAMKIMQYFTDFGLAEWMGEESAGQVGRKPQVYAFNPEAAHIIAVLHEGSIISVGILNLACELLAEETAEVRGGIHDLLVEQPCEIAERLIADLAEKGRTVTRLLGMGLCLPGVVDDVHQEISFAPSFALNTSYQIETLLTEAGARIGAPVYIENDVNAAVYGEFYCIKASDMAFISIGSNVGMGLVLDGKLRRGPSFTAGEIGLMPYGNEASPHLLRNIEEIIGLDALKKRFGFDRRFGLSEMIPEARAVMIDTISDVIANIIVTCSAMINISDFVLGGLTVELLGEEFFDAVQRKAGRLSPFGITVRHQSVTNPALIGGSRKVTDMRLDTLLALDSTEDKKEEVKEGITYS